MCAIFGLLNKIVDENSAKEALDRMIHRGPDDGMIWQEGEVCLGHRRLAILDLSSAGAQPMADASGRYVIVFNGEIYNFVELKKELTATGCEFKSNSDTEVLLYAYIKWGKDCLNRFNGMWAFAIWDREKKELFLSRDRYGVKPLFYTRYGMNERFFAFASEMKALTPFMKEVRPNRHLLSDPTLMTEYESTGECVIEEIERFPAGCCGYFYPATGELKVERYYETLSNLMEVPDSYEEQTALFREIFLDSCAIRMRSDVTLGTALSGGLDSSATICSMAHLSLNSKTERMGHNWQHAYVAAFPGTVMDERKYAKMVTDHLWIGSTEVVIDPIKALPKLENYLYLFEDVYLTSPIPMMELYGALRADGTIVTLDGHGADELFGGYTFDFINALKDAGSDENDRKMILDAYIESFPNDGSNAALKDRSYEAVERTFRKRDLKKRLKGMLSMRRENKMPEGFDKLDSLNKILYKSVHTNILPTLLRNYDRYSMANSVEIRMPFMDHRVVELAFSIGWRSKLHGGYSKSIIRDALSDIMPKEVAYRRTKIGFNTPIVEWMKGPMKEYFEDICADTSFVNCDLINPAKVKAAVNHVIYDEGATLADGEKAFSLLYPYLWELSFLKRCRS